MGRLQKALVSQRMRQAREEAGLTQEVMADLLGVHKRVVENVENDRLVKGPYHYVNAWADVTGHPMEWILHGEREAATGSHEEELEAVLEAIGRLEQHLAVIEQRLDELQAAEGVEEATNGLE